MQLVFAAFDRSSLKSQEAIAFDRLSSPDHRGQLWVCHPWRNGRSYLKMRHRAIASDFGLSLHLITAFDAAGSARTRSKLEEKI
ncbi:hypothetical protein [Paraburkholderia caribensis]|uniref:hypothetical protein n=1 Tax=Paraburkholderia caribensis TaxID=75105 RepID=UPI0012E9833E|nr:hypothetical protein [Paraburkholderia caribensis]